ncbi:MAG: NADH-quinone oxidoreductase subunit NuoE [Desulfobacterales bacterium]|nr:NADH-quinone oxidoreductase subunit NuoE [Desulfobacterales bacterium]
MSANTSVAQERDELQEFSPEQLAAVDAIIEHHQLKPGALIPVLEEIQEAIGYLPKAIQRKVAFGLKIPFSEIYGVVTFYSFFTIKPRGRHTIRTCLGTACYVRGGKRIAESLAQAFGIKDGETTPDRRFTFETVRCLGACGLGPAMVVDNDVHGRVKPAKVKDILEPYI